MLADLQGQIERITYTNDETGYTVAKLRVYGQRDLVTVVGNLMAPILFADDNPLGLLSSSRKPHFEKRICESIKTWALTNTDPFALI